MEYNRSNLQQETNGLDVNKNVVHISHVWAVCIQFVPKLMREAIKLKFKYQLQEEDKGWAGISPLLVWTEYLFSAKTCDTFALLSILLRHTACDMYNHLSNLTKVWGWQDTNCVLMYCDRADCRLHCRRVLSLCKISYFVTVSHVPMGGHVENGWRYF